MLSIMRIFVISLLLALPFSVSAQTTPTPQDVPAPEGLQAPEPLLRIRPAQPQESEETDSEGLVVETPERETQGAEVIEGEDLVPESLEPDYAQMSPTAERTARLDDLFIKLAAREDEEGANLIAEEILAIWVDSGSASVNLLLRRGTDASAKGNPKLARKMYNHAADLSPEFSEVWARSARLALTQKDYNRALNESLKTLTLEPRHFYALWTLGNVFEALGRSDEALEAYREANRLYPQLAPVKERLERLEKSIQGSVL